MTSSAPFLAWERRTTAPSLVFDLVDGLLAERRTAERRPRPRGGVRYRIVAEETGGVRAVLAEPFDMVMVRNTAGADLWFGAVRRGPGPASRYRPQPGTAAVVQIATDRYQRAEVVVAQLPRPAPPISLVLQPGWAYEFSAATAVPGSIGPTLLRGTLRLADGGRVTGARLRVDPPPAGQPPPGPEYVTDETGSWVLPFDDAVTSTAAARVEITTPAGPPVPVPEVTITRGDSSTLRQASLAGTARRASGAALAGVVISADAAPGGSARSAADGRWELWLPIERFPPSAGSPAVAVTAIPPDGGPALIRTGEIRPRGTAPFAPLVFP